MAPTVQALLQKSVLYAECVLQVKRPNGGTLADDIYATRSTGIETVLESYRDRDDAVSTVLVPRSSDSRTILETVLSTLATTKVGWEDDETYESISLETATQLEGLIARLSDDFDSDSSIARLTAGAPLLWYYHDDGVFAPGQIAQEMLVLDSSVLDVRLEAGKASVRATAEGLELTCDIRIAQQWALDEVRSGAPEGFRKDMKHVLGVEDDFYGATLVLNRATGGIRSFTLHKD